MKLADLFIALEFDRSDIDNAIAAGFNPVVSRSNATKVSARGETFSPSPFEKGGIEGGFEMSSEIKVRESLRNQRSKVPVRCSIRQAPTLRDQPGASHRLSTL